MRKNKIINYFIILQLFKFKREKAREFFVKYIDVLGKDFNVCLYDFEKQDQKKCKDFNSAILITSLNTFLQFENNILYFEDSNFPARLRFCKEHPICLFYSGNLSLFNYFSLSIVGTRNPNEKTFDDTKRISKYLCAKEVVVVSGLAKGVDVTAHMECQLLDYRNAIAVVATPLGKYYPAENKEIQQQIERNGLLITEVPPFEITTSSSFLRRNYIMSVISNATIVMQAGDVSGTISQARSTLKNGKKLFVPASVFDDKNNSWPSKFIEDYGNIFRFEKLTDLEKLIKYERLV